LFFIDRWLAEHVMNVYQYSPTVYSVSVANKYVFINLKSIEREHSTKVT